MKNNHLGEFEELVLLSVASLRDDAYAVSVQQLIEEEARRPASMGAVYSSLDRLEQKGFVRSDLGDVTHERGGRRKRYYRITGSGQKALLQTREARENLWKGVKLEPEVRFSA